MMMAMEDAVDWKKKKKECCWKVGGSVGRWSLCRCVDGSLCRWVAAGGCCDTDSDYREAASLGAGGSAGPPSRIDRYKARNIYRNIHPPTAHTKAKGAPASPPASPACAYIVHHHRPKCLSRAAPALVRIRLRSRRQLPPAQLAVHFDPHRAIPCAPAFISAISSPPISIAMHRHRHRHRRRPAVLRP